MADIAGAEITKEKIELGNCIREVGIPAAVDNIDSLACVRMKQAQAVLLRLLAGRGAGRGEGDERRHQAEQTARDPQPPDNRLDFSGHLHASSLWPRRARAKSRETITTSSHSYFPKVIPSCPPRNNIRLPRDSRQEYDEFPTRALSPAPRSRLSAE